MDNDILHAPIDMTGQSSLVLDGILLQTISEALDQNQPLVGYPLLSSFQGGSATGDPYDYCMRNQADGFYSGDFVPSLGRNVSNVRSSCSVEFKDQSFGGTSISSNPLTSTLLATSSESLNDLAISSIVSDVNHTIGNLNAFPTHSELCRKSETRMDFQSYPVLENVDSNGWMSENDAFFRMHYPYGSPKLSLSLASYQRSVTSGPNDQAQCSEISSSGVTRHCSKEPGNGLEQTSSNYRDLSLSFGSTRHAHTQLPSQVILGSRYLHVIQEILAQVASYSLENLDLNSYSAHMTQMQANMSFSSHYIDDENMRGSSFYGHEEFLDARGRPQDQVQPPVQRRALEAKKTQLLNLLEAVDDQYSQCLDEMHTVVSAFHAATELDPQIHTRFALQTISFLYKSLREQISNHILALGTHYNSSERSSPESLFVQKQWALQQLKRKDQLWRPQRGLPERSVSVLRAWMFQNFLHPYPKDAEKHLLAVKSGLSRSQVSNWFINARVRLWKPMIEEMHAEINCRKAKRNKEDNYNNHQNLIDYQRSSVINGSWE